MTQTVESSALQVWAGYGLTIAVDAQDTRRSSLRLVGELDMASASLVDACLESLRDAGQRYVRLNMSGLTFMDAAGLSVLLEAHDAFLARRSTLIFTELSTRVARVMQLTGADKVLLIASYPSDTASPQATAPERRRLRTIPRPGAYPRPG